MKAQFKYSFLTGLHTRGGVFAVILVMNLVFSILGLLGLLPIAALITAVSLGGTAIGVMAIINVISDVSIIRRMFAAPGAYLYALTPVPRRKTLLSSIITMFVLDTVTMLISIAGVVVTSLLLGGYYDRTLRNYITWSNISAWLSANDIVFGLWFIALLIAWYLLIVTVILFCVTARKSIFYQKPGGGILTALLAIGTFYVISVMPLLFAPFAWIDRWGMFFVVNLDRTGVVAYVLLTLAQTAALYVLTSKLMERKLNI